MGRRFCPPSGDQTSVGNRTPIWAPPDPVLSPRGSRCAAGPVGQHGGPDRWTEPAGATAPRTSLLLCGSPRTPQTQQPRFSTWKTQFRGWFASSCSVLSYSIKLYLPPLHITGETASPGLDQPGQTHRPHLSQENLETVIILSPFVIKTIANNMDTRSQ